LKKSTYLIIPYLLLLSIILAITAITIYYSFKYLSESEKYPLVEVNNNNVTINSTKLSLWLHSIFLLIMSSILMLVLALLVCAIVDVIMKREW
jgi:hypothetical protein